MTDNNNWDMYSEEMEEDLIMEDDVDDEEMEVSSSGGAEKAVYPDGYSRGEGVISPRFNQMSTLTDFARYDFNSASPIQNFGDSLDEKGDSIALLMQMEKTIVHQNFVDNFEDDFDDEDFA